MKKIRDEIKFSTPEELSEIISQLPWSGAGEDALRAYAKAKSIKLQKRSPLTLPTALIFSHFGSRTRSAAPFNAGPAEPPTWADARLEVSSGANFGGLLPGKASSP